MYFEKKKYQNIRYKSIVIPIEKIEKGIQLVREFIKELKPKYISINIIAEQVSRFYKIEIIEIAVKKRVFIFLLEKLRSDHNINSMKLLFEDTSVCKLMYDSRVIQDSLLHQLGIKFKNIIDLQILSSIILLKTPFDNNYVSVHTLEKTLEFFNLEKELEYTTLIFPSIIKCFMNIFKKNEIKYYCLDIFLKDEHKPMHTQFLKDENEIWEHIKLKFPIQRNKVSHDKNKNLIQIYFSSITDVNHDVRDIFLNILNKYNFSIIKTVRHQMFFDKKISNLNYYKKISSRRCLFLAKLTNDELIEYSKSSIINNVDFYNSNYHYNSEIQKHLIESNIIKLRKLFTPKII